MSKTKKASFSTSSSLVLNSASHGHDRRSCSQSTTLSSAFTSSGSSICSTLLLSASERSAVQRNIFNNSCQFTENVSPAAPSCEINHQRSVFCFKCKPNYHCQQIPVHSNEQLSLVNTMSSSMDAEACCKSRIDEGELLQEPLEVTARRNVSQTTSDAKRRIGELLGENHCLKLDRFRICLTQS